MTNETDNVQIVDSDTTVPAPVSVAPAQESPNLDANENFFNRELSWLDFESSQSSLLWFKRFGLL